LGDKIAVIDVQNLTKTYGTARGIENVTFKVEKGEILGFLGPNGAGKTTTMRILTCFMPATSGKATIGGYDIFEDSIEVRKRIGYMPETVPLYLDMMVPAYLKYVAGLKGLAFKEINKAVSLVMEKVGLQDKASRLIGELSKGYRQRVGLAQALINDPEVLILDEPTAGLDPRQIIDIRSLIKDLGGDRTIILSSHILPEVSMICERVAIIDEGQIKAMDRPEDLMKKLKSTTRVTVRMTGDVELVKEAMSKVDEVKSVEHLSDDKENATDSNRYMVDFNEGQSSPHRLAYMASEKGWDLHELTPMKMSLEDIFIKIVTSEEIKQ